MDNRIATFSFEDFTFDPQDTGKVLTDTCANLPLKYRVAGAGVLMNQVVVTLHKNHHLDEVFHYIVDELGDLDDDEIIDIINRRWVGNYTTIAIFKVYNSYYGIFERREVLEDE